MTIPDSLVTALLSFAVPALGGWIWSIQNIVTKHNQILFKLDQLVDLLLKDRLNK